MTAISSPPVSPQTSPETVSLTPTPSSSGCRTGTVAITHRAGVDPPTADICIRLNSNLQITLAPEGEHGWSPLRVAPATAATVKSSSDANGTTYATMTPRAAGVFTLTTNTTDPTAPTDSWKLTVTVQP